MYSIEKNGNKVLTLRQITAFLKDFGFFDPSMFKKLEVVTLELLFNQKVQKKLCDFKNFIEILFKLSKVIKIIIIFIIYDDFFEAIF